MTVHRGNVLDVVNKAWELARDRRSPDQDIGKRNRLRSSDWVRALAETFENEYRVSGVHRVFWLGNDTNREQFGINEYLFDVMVCSVSTVESLQRQSNRLDFIDQCHWQVESEFNRSNSREVIVDMSKLVVGSAENKLFIAAHRKSGEQDLLKLCAGIARRCLGAVYFAFVAHPDEWDDTPMEPYLYEWLEGYWVRIEQHR